MKKVSREISLLVGMKFSVRFIACDEGGYTAECPELPGLVTEGDTLVETKSAVRDAIRLYIRALVKESKPVVAPKKLGERVVDRRPKPDPCLRDYEIDGYPEDGPNDLADIGFIF